MRFLKICLWCQLSVLSVHQVSVWCPSGVRQVSARCPLGVQGVNQVYRQIFRGVLQVSIFSTCRGVGVNPNLRSKGMGN